MLDNLPHYGRKVGSDRNVVFKTHDAYSLDRAYDKCNSYEYGGDAEKSTEEDTKRAAKVFRTHSKEVKFGAIDDDRED